MAVFIVADVDDTKLWGEGHLVNRWASRIGIELRNNIKAEAPVNKRPNTGHGAPGGLRRSIGVRKSRVGAKRITLTISGVYYGEYVNDGTGTITSRKKMFLPPNFGYDGRRGVKQVRGQAANNFIERGYAITASHHQALG